MKKFEVVVGGRNHVAIAARMVVEAGALVFYSARDEAAREEIVAAWGPGQWQSVFALDSAGTKLAGSA